MQQRETFKALHPVQVPGHAQINNIKTYYYESNEFLHRKRLGWFKL